jgi:putative peptidoglycan lipid II flippase
MTAQALIAYGVGLMGLILVKILAPGFYAKQDIRTPVKIAIGVLIATQIMNYLFVPMIAHAGLALSIGLGATINAGILFFFLKKRGLYQPSVGWTLFLIRLLGALLILAGIGMWAGSQFDWISLRATPLLRIADLLLIIVLCMVSYFGALFAMGFRLQDFKRIST